MSPKDTSSSDAFSEGFAISFDGNDSVDFGLASVVVLIDPSWVWPAFAVSRSLSENKIFVSTWQEVHHEQQQHSLTKILAAVVIAAAAILATAKKSFIKSSCNNNSNCSSNFRDKNSNSSHSNTLNAVIINSSNNKSSPSKSNTNKSSNIKGSNNSNFKSNNSNTHYYSKISRCKSNIIISSSNNSKNLTSGKTSRWRRVPFHRRRKRPADDRRNCETARKTPDPESGRRSRCADTGTCPARQRLHRKLGQEEGLSTFLFYSSYRKTILLQKFDFWSLWGSKSNWPIFRKFGNDPFMGSEIKCFFMGTFTQGADSDYRYLDNCRKTAIKL